jgi:very-short-patch-repair endonuclease
MLERKLMLRDAFIAKANIAHNNKFDYNKVDYVNAHTKITITCPRHGDFSQMPNSHLAPTDCPSCGQEQRAKSKKFTNEDFIKKSQLVHGDRYDYSDTVYIGAKHKVTIRCRKHGLFEQKAMSHMLGMKCMECWNDERALTQEEFLQRAFRVHGDRYKYDAVKYVNYETKICIKCEKHGYFWQLPGVHLEDKGCKECKNSIGEAKLSLLFKLMNLGYVTEIRFPTCRADSYTLPFDFYLAMHNLLVEFDGDQHFKVVKLWGGDEGFRKRIHHDIVKDNWCRANGKFLLRVSYEDINNLEEIIKLAIEFIETSQAEELDPKNPQGFIMATSFYDSICTTKNPNSIRDTSHYLTIA